MQLKQTVIVISQDSNTLISASGTIMTMWDKEGHVLRRPIVKKHMFSLASQPDIRMQQHMTIASGDVDKDNAVATDGVRRMENDAVAASANVRAGAEHTASKQKYDQSSGKMGNEELEQADTKMTLHGHVGKVMCCIISNDGNFIVSGAADSTVRLWDTATGLQMETYGSPFLGHTDTVSCLCMNGVECIISGSWDGTLRRWNPACMSADRCGMVYGGDQEFIEKSYCKVTCCVMGQSGLWFVSGTGTLYTPGILTVWHVATGQSIWQGSPSTISPALPPISVQIAAPQEPLFSATSGFAGHKRGIICCELSQVDLAPKNDEIFPADSNNGDSNPPNAQGLRPEYGARLLSGSADKTLKWWDLRTGECLVSFEGHKSWVSCCAITHDQTAVLSGSYDHTVRSWSVASAMCATIVKHSSPVLNCFFSNDHAGKWMYSCSANEIFMASRSSGQLVFHHPAYHERITRMCLWLHPTGEEPGMLAYGTTDGEFYWASACFQTGTKTLRCRLQKLRFRVPE